MTYTEAPPMVSTKNTPPGGYYGDLSSCLFNLIVYVPSAHKKTWLRTLVTDLVEIFPSRIIFIEQVSDQEASSPQVSINTTTDSKRESSSYEEVSIRFQKAHRQRVPFMATPYILPDIPVLMVWGEDPTSDMDILPGLTQIAHRLIFDSDTSDTLRRFSFGLLKQRKDLALDLIDFNWVRIKSWRSALEKVFDTSERLEELRTAREITITFNDCQDHSFQKSLTQSIYLQAWLATQLGWATQEITSSQGVHKATYTHDCGSTHVSLVPKPIDGHRAGSLVRVDVHSRESRTYRIERMAGTCQASVTITSPVECHLPFTVMLRRPQRRFQFFKELFYGRTGPKYFDMLATLSQQNWSAGNDCR